MDKETHRTTYLLVNHSQALHRTFQLGNLYNLRLCSHPLNFYRSLQDRVETAVPPCNNNLQGTLMV